MKIWKFILLAGVLAFGGLEAEGGAIEASGIVVPCEQIELAVASDGIIDVLNVSEGDRVKQGEAIGNLNLSSTEVELKRRKLISEKLTSTFASAKRLYADKLMSKDDFDQVEIELLTNKAEQDLAQIHYDERFIKAPFEGYVLRLMKKKGEAVQRLETVAKLVSIRRLNVIVYLDADKIQKVFDGQKVEARIDSVPDQVFNGVVETVDPVIDPGSGLFRVKISIDNPEEKVRSGPRASVKILLPDAPTSSPAP
jgi:RND family efflux transporter MFP subunit